MKSYLINKDNSNNLYNPNQTDVLNGAKSEERETNYLVENIEVISPTVLSNFPNETKKKLKTRIADDEGLVKKYLSIILKHENRELLFAKNGAEAVPVFNDNSNVDLMDVKMPELNGFEANRRIRQLNKDTPIISQSPYWSLVIR